RTRRPPRSRTSSLPRTRGGRGDWSLSQIAQPMVPWATVLARAAVRAAARGARGGGGAGGRGAEPLREGAALVGLDVAEGDPAQPSQVHDAGGGPRHRRVERALAAVEEQRLLRVDQELVEGEALRPHRGQEGREAVD